MGDTCCVAALGNPVELNALGVTDNFGYTNLSFEKKTLHTSGQDVCFDKSVPKKQLKIFHTNHNNIYKAEPNNKNTYPNLILDKGWRGLQ